MIPLHRSQSYCAVGRIGTMGAGAGVQDAFLGDAGGRAAGGDIQEHENG